MRPILLAVFLAAVTSTASAATRFDFDCRKEGFGGFEFHGHAILEGTDVRYDITSGNHPLFNPEYTIISKDRGARLIVLDHRHRTYFIRDTLRMTGPLGTFRAPGQETITKRSVHLSDEERGADARVYTLRVSYAADVKLEGEEMRAQVTAVAHVTTSLLADAKAVPYGLAFALKTGDRDLDFDIANLMQKRGLPLHQQVRVTRIIADGSPSTEELTLDTSNLRTIANEAWHFQPPAAYAPAEPNFRIGE